MMFRSLAQSDRASHLSPRRRLAISVVPLTIITVSLLVLVAGGAAAAGVDLGSVPQRVVNVLAEEMPLSAQTTEARHSNTNNVRLGGSTGGLDPSHGHANENQSGRTDIQPSPDPKEAPRSGSPNNHLRDMSPLPAMPGHRDQHDPAAPGHATPSPHVPSGNGPSPQGKGAPPGAPEDNESDSPRQASAGGAAHAAGQDDGRSSGAIDRGPLNDQSDENSIDDPRSARPDVASGQDKARPSDSPGNAGGASIPARPE